MTWGVGDLLAGETKSVDLPGVSAGTAPDGALIDFSASARDDQGIEMHRNASLRVQGDSLYDLAIAVSDDPATAGSLLTYELTYAYRADAGAVNDSVLRLPVPTGTTFVSASGGGVSSGGNIECNPGFLSPVAGGILEAVVMLGAGLDASDVIEATAEVFSASSPLEHARSQVNSAVRSGISLSLDLNAVTFTAAPSRDLRVL